MEGDPRFPASQRVPDFSWADYARLLGLGAIRIDRAEDIDQAWATALAADRPTVIEAIVDPATPLLPPRSPEQKVEKMQSGLAREGNDAAAHQLRRQREQEDEHADGAGLLTVRQGRWSMASQGLEPGWSRWMAMASRPIRDASAPDSASSKPDRRPASAAATRCS